MNLIGKRGVYHIRCDNGRVYVGSSKDVRKRLAQHRHCLEIERHPIEAMQDDWNELGPSSFTFEFVEEVAPTEPLLDEAENRHISECPPDKLYNIRRSAHRWTPRDETYQDDTTPTGWVDEDYVALIRSGAWHPRLTPPAEDVVKYLVPHLCEIIERQRLLLGLLQTELPEGDDSDILHIRLPVLQPGPYILKLRPVPGSAPEIIGVIPVE